MKSVLLVLLLASPVCCGEIQDFIDRYEAVHGTRAEQAAEVDRAIADSCPPVDTEDLLFEQTIEIDTDDTLVFEELNITDPVPAYAKRLKRSDYAAWAKAQNAMAYFEAAARAAKQSFGPTVFTSSTTQTGGWRSILDWSYDSLGEWTTTTTERAWTSPQWGGGPVTIINPYVRPK